MGDRVTVGADVTDGAGDIDGRGDGAAVDGAGDGAWLREGARDIVGPIVY